MDKKVANAYVAGFNSRYAGKIHQQIGERCLRGLRFNSRYAGKIHLKMINDNNQTFRFQFPLCG